MTKPRQTITHIKAELLTAHPDNIRDDLGDLGDLARSIIEHGILQPITVTEHRLGGFLILAGHRRFAAGRQAGLTSFPAIIRHDLTDHAEQLVVMLVENTQRRDLNPVERAEAYGALRNHGLSQSEIARRVGSPPATVAYYMALLDLDDSSRDLVRDGQINSTEAVAAVREARQQGRAATGLPLRGKPVAYFGPAHRLANRVRARCTHLDRPRVGFSGCGPCWEQTICDEAATGAPHGDAVHLVDDVLVERILASDWKAAKEANPAERRAVALRWLAGDRSISELARLTGWKVERYAHATEVVLENDEAAS